MESLAELRAKPHTSVSQLKTFIACPRAYFFRYIERAPASFRALALVFGTAWHTTIAEYLLSGRAESPRTLEQLRASLRDGLVRGIAVDGPPVLFEEEEQDVGAVVDRALQMLDVFVKRVPVPETVHGVEVLFSLLLVHPKTGEVLPAPLIGAIDAVVEEEGSTILWELKTGKKKWSGDQFDFDFQPTAYVMAARELGHGDLGLKLLVTTKTKTPDVQIERLVRHKRDERELVNVAFSVHRGVRAGVDHPARGWPCRTCPFADRCAA